DRAELRLDAPERSKNRDDDPTSHARTTGREPCGFSVSATFRSQLDVEVLEDDRDAAHVEALHFVLNDADARIRSETCGAGATFAQAPKEAFGETRADRRCEKSRGIGAGVAIERFLEAETKLLP